MKEVLKLEYLDRFYKLMHMKLNLEPANNFALNWYAANLLQSGSKCLVFRGNLEVTSL